MFIQSEIFLVEGFVQILLVLYDCLSLCYVMYEQPGKLPEYQDCHTQKVRA